jgi:hypothetical protein
MVGEVSGEEALKEKKNWKLQLIKRQKRKLQVLTKRKSYYS